MGWLFTDNADGHDGDPSAPARHLSVVQGYVHSDAGLVLAGQPVLPPLPLLHETLNDCLIPYH